MPSPVLRWAAVTLVSLVLVACGNSVESGPGPSDIVKEWYSALYAGDIEALDRIAHPPAQEQLYCKPWSRGWSGLFREFPEPVVEIKRILREGPRTRVWFALKGARLPHTLRTLQYADLLQAEALGGDGPHMRLVEIAGAYPHPTGSPPFPTLVCIPRVDCGVEYWSRPLDIVFHISRDGRVFADDPTPANMNSIRDMLRESTSGAEWRDPHGGSLRRLLINADRSAPWRVVKEILLMAADAGIGIWRVSFGVHGVSRCPVYRYLPIFLPLDDGSAHSELVALAGHYLTVDVLPCRPDQTGRSCTGIRIDTEKVFHFPQGTWANTPADNAERTAAYARVRTEIGDALVRTWRSMGTSPETRGRIRVRSESIPYGDVVQVMASFIRVGLGDVKIAGVSCAIDAETGAEED